VVAAGEFGAGFGIAGADCVACAQPGATNKRVAQDLRVVPNTVGKWRRRFVESRLEGLVDEDRPDGRLDHS